MASSLGTTFAQIFLRPKYSAVIFQTQSRLMFSSSAIIRNVSRRSPRIVRLTRSTFASVLLVEGFLFFFASSYLQSPPRITCATQKHMMSTLHLFQKIAAAMSVPQMEFYPTGPKILYLLVAQCSSLHNFVFF